MIVTAQLWGSKPDDELLNNIHELLTQCKACELSSADCPWRAWLTSYPAAGKAPLAILRPVFLHLREQARLSRLSPRLLELLHNRHISDDTLDVHFRECGGEVSPDLRRQLRKSLRTHLFGRNTFLAQRLRVMLLGFCRVRAMCTRQIGI